MSKSKTKIKTAYDIDFDKLDAHIPNLPDDIDSWIHNVLFANRNYFFTKTEKDIKSGICTHCQTKSQIYPLEKKSVTPEDLERISTKHNKLSTCPHCKKQVQFKDNGRSRKNLIDYGYFYILQPVKYGGIVLRTFYCYRRWNNIDLFNCNHLPEIEYSEHFRIFMHKNVHACFKRSQYGWWYKLKSIIEPHCHYGNTYASTVFRVATYKFESWKRIISETEYKYSCLDEWAFKPDVAMKYLELYSKCPILVERLMKQGYKTVLEDKIIENQATHGIIDFNKETPAEAFKLSKATLNTLGKKLTILDIAKASFLEHNRCSEKTVEYINCLRKNSLMKFKSICKFLNSVANANKICKYIRQQVKISNHYDSTTLSDYYDYIQQIKKLSLPINTGTVFPPNLQTAHSQTTKMLNELKMEVERKKIEEIDKGFEPKYQKLYKKYAYENEYFIVRPAKGKQELFVEGSTLHHCVYSNYADRYLSGNVLIILIREKDKPDTPFYTLELNPKNNVVVQCRTSHNQSYTENKAVSELIKEYLEFLTLSERKQNKTKQHYSAA